MKITSSRKKFAAYVEAAFSQSFSKKEGHKKAGRTISLTRDRREINVDARRKLIFRESFHTGEAEAFAKFLQRKKRFKDFVVVPIKSMDVPAYIDGKKVANVMGSAQRYFHRPSLGSLQWYLSHELKGRHKLHGKNVLHSLDVSYCMRLMHTNPNINYEQVLGAVNVLSKEFVAARESGVVMKGFGFDASNFLVFGLDKKSGKLKIGVVDV